MAPIDATEAVHAVAEILATETGAAGRLRILEAMLVLSPRAAVVLLAIHQIERWAKHSQREALRVRCVTVMDAMLSTAPRDESAG